MATPEQPPTARALRGAMLRVGLAAFLVAVVAVPARATAGARVTSDEPQYLLSALSLGEDLDLDISDEIAAERFRPFHETGLDPQTIPLTEGGQQISPHDPLLPVVLAVPMRLGGWAAAKATLAGIAGALAALTLWFAVRRLAVGLGPAQLVVAGFAVTAPLVAYGTQVYPEIPAALAVMAAVSATTGPLGRRALLVLALSLVALPWLSVKCVPVAAAIGGAVAVTLVRRPRTRSEQRVAGALLAVVAIAALVYVLVHQRIYGGWTVYASGDHFVGNEWRVVGSTPNYLGRSERLLGLLVDREFGLAAWNPAWLAAVPAIAALIRRRPSGWLHMVAPMVAGWAVATWVALTMHGWWWPGRQVVVVLPIAVAAVAWWLDGLARARMLAVFAGATALGLLSWLWLVVEASTGRRTLIVDFAQTANPWYRGWRLLLPDMRQPSATTTALALAWVAGVALLAVIGWRTARTADPAGRGSAVGATPSSVRPRHRVGAGAPGEVAPRAVRDRVS